MTRRNTLAPVVRRLCPACHVEGRPWAAKRQYRLDRCGVCGALFVSHADLAPDVAETYAHYHSSASFVAPDVVETSLRRLVESARPYRRKGFWLDLGFGEGALLSAAESEGWACFGSEVSPHALDFGRTRGWTVSGNLTQDHRFQPGSFDVVTMIEVIEHLDDAGRLLHDASRLLRPGGLFYLTTPNARSLNRWLLGAKWSIVCPPEHLTLWTAVGLRRLLVRSGLRDVRVRTEGFNPAEVMARVRFGNSTSEVNRQSTGIALSQALSRTRSRRAFKRLANSILDLLGLGDTLKARAEKSDTDDPALRVPYRVPQDL